MTKLRVLFVVLLLCGAALAQSSNGHRIASASDVVNLFSSCSGTEYLGADGACHSGSGGGSVTSAGLQVNGGTTPCGALTLAGTNPVTTTGTINLVWTGVNGDIITFNGSNCPQDSGTLLSALAPKVTGAQGQPFVNTTGAQVYATSPVYVDASQFPVTTGSGAIDVCAEAVAAENSILNNNGSAGVVIVPVPRKAYCSEFPFAANFKGQVYFRGLSNRARIYVGVSMTGWGSGEYIFGTGATGSTVANNSQNVIWIACNPNLHDNTYPTNSDGAPCAGYFNSTTNMPQATVTSITAASAGASTITLSGTLSGTPPSTFAGRLLCVGKETASAVNGHCWEINAEPTGGGTIFVVNSTSMVACNSTCGGKAYLDTAQVSFSQGATNGSTFYHAGMEESTLDCAYVYGCSNFVNGAGEEGTYLTNIQAFNATVFAFRLFVGNNTSPNAYGGDKGGGSHSGPYTRLFTNFQAETCEIHTGGCWGMNNGVNSGALTQFVAGTQMMAGTPAIMPNAGCPAACTYAVLAYNSSVAISPMSKTFAGIVSDGIAMGTNSQSFYGVNGSTVSLKDVQNSGTHAILPELTEGLGYFQTGPSNKFDGYHAEYTVIAQEIGGMATHNETWIEDGSTQTQGATWTNGDSNNASTYNFELGSAQGTSNVMNFSATNMSTITGTPSTKMLKNDIQANADCNVSTENNIWYTFAQTSAQPLLLSDCSSAQNIIATPLNNLPGSFTFQAWCDGGVNATTGTYAIQPFNNSSVTSNSCTTLTTSAGVNFSAPITTQAGKCSIYVAGVANATNAVTFTVNNTTQLTSATSVVASGSNHHEVDAATLGFTKNDRYNVTMNVGTSDAFTNPRVNVTCW